MYWQKTRCQLLSLDTSKSSGTGHAVNKTKVSTSPRADAGWRQPAASVLKGIKGPVMSRAVLPSLGRPFGSVRNTLTRAALWRLWNGKGQKSTKTMSLTHLGMFPLRLQNLLAHQSRTSLAILRLARLQLGWVKSASSNVCGIGDYLELQKNYQPPSGFIGITEWDRLKETPLVHPWFTSAAISVEDRL